MIDEALVADLLRQSMAKHRAALPPSRERRDVLKALELWAEALDLRKQAHHADPKHKAQVWSNVDLAGDHDALMEFYREKLGG